MKTKVKNTIQKFQVELFQVNKSGTTNFAAKANEIKVKDFETLALEISDFCHDTANLWNKLKSLKVPGSGANSIKKSSKMYIKMTAKEDNTTVSIQIRDFGKFLSNSTKETTSEVIVMLVNHTSKFAHLWA